MSFYPQDSLYNINKPIYFWLDEIITSHTFNYPDSIINFLKDAKDLGVTDIVIEAKGISGEVIYPSSIALRTNLLDDFYSNNNDFLLLLINYCHNFNLKAHVAINVFTEGDLDSNRGLAIGDSSHWQTIINTKDGLKNYSQLGKGNAVYVNPTNSIIQDYELSIINEIVTRYNIDGIVFKNFSFEPDGDFSLTTKGKFEEYLGTSITNYPGDIFRWQQVSDSTYSKIRGSYFNKWVEFKNKIIYDFFTKVKNLIHSKNPTLKLYCFNSDLHLKSIEKGVNEASLISDPSIFGDYYSPSLINFSILPFINSYMAGYYYYDIDSNDINDFNNYVQENPYLNLRLKDMSKTISYHLGEIKEITKQEKPIISGINVFNYKDKGELLKKAIIFAYNKSDGIMFYDASLIHEYGWWAFIKSCLQEVQL